MLPSKLRIHKSFFEEIFKKGFFYSGQNINLVLLKKPEITKYGSKFAFSVSKKNVKNAVKRNFLRRRGFSVIKNSKNDIKTGFLGVFVLKTGAEK